MLKRYALMILLLVALPTVAHAWTINASPGGGGTISPKGYISVAGTAGTFKDFIITTNARFVVPAGAVNTKEEPVPG